MPGPPPPVAPQPPETSDPRDATLIEVIGAVFWSFFGIRKSKAMQRDAARIRPHQVIIVGVLAAAAFVFTLLLLVQVVIHVAGAP